MILYFVRFEMIASGTHMISGPHAARLFETPEPEGLGHFTFTQAFLKSLIIQTNLSRDGPGYRGLGFDYPRIGNG